MGLGSRLFSSFFRGLGRWLLRCIFLREAARVGCCSTKKPSSFLLRWWMSIYHLKGREGGTKQAAGDEANETKGTATLYKMLNFGITFSSGTKKVNNNKNNNFAHLAFFLLNCANVS